MTSVLVQFNHKKTGASPWNGILTSLSKLGLLIASYFPYFSLNRVDFLAESSVGKVLLCKIQSRGQGGHISADYSAGTLQLIMFICQDVLVLVLYKYRYIFLCKLATLYFCSSDWSMNCIISMEFRFMAQCLHIF